MADAQNRELSRSKLEGAKEKLNMGQQSEAWALLSKALDLDPKNEVAWEIAYGLLPKDDLAKRKAFLKKWLQHSPNSVKGKELQSQITASESMMNRRKAGASVYKMAETRGRQINVLLIAAIVVALVTIFLLVNSDRLGLGGASILLLLLLLRVLPDIIDRVTRKKARAEKRAIRGAKAEVRVAELLSQLPEGYEALHDIESQFGNIDHVLLTQTGAVFLLETKSHYGKIQFQENELRLNRKKLEKDFKNQALSNTYWLRDEIHKIIGTDVWITPILVFTNAFVPRSDPIKGVYVINAKFLTSTITRLSRRDKSNHEVWERRSEVVSRLS